MAYGLLTENKGAAPSGGTEYYMSNPDAAPAGRSTHDDEHCPVLIVEDDADLREMMAQLLSLEGFRAQTASNGREALTYMQSGDHPDIILLDLMMPVMDGWEFRRHQQEDPSISGIPVVVLSALDPSRAGDLRPQAFLKKPLDFDRLLDIVRTHCRSES
jgi:CheY-like chemotaxis protein